MAIEFNYLDNDPDKSTLAHSNLGVNLNRQKYGPLDGSSVFTSLKDLEYYIKKGAYDQKFIDTPPLSDGVSNYVSKWMTQYPYVGQVVSVVDASLSSVTVYKITDVAECKYKKVGSGSNALSDCMQLSGGTMRGDIVLSNDSLTAGYDPLNDWTSVIRSNSVSSGIAVFGGDTNLAGAGLYLFGNNNEESHGNFVLRSMLSGSDDRLKKVDLKGEYLSNDVSGETKQLTWDDKNIVRSVNYHQADIGGNVSLNTEIWELTLDDDTTVSARICMEYLLKPVVVSKWDKIVTALENASESDFDKDTLEYTGDNDVLKSIPVSGCVSVAYQVNDNDDSSIVSSAWLNLGFNASIPEYVKYKDASGNKVYVRSLSTDASNADVLTSITAGHEIYTKSWDEDNLSNVYETNGEKVAAVDGSFSYGNLNPYTVPTSLTADSGKVYTFCGYNITLNQRDLMLDTTHNSAATYTGVYFDKDSSYSNRYRDSKIRSMLNSKDGSADANDGNSDYTIGSFVSKVASDDGFLENVANAVNRTWVYGGGEDDLADRFWLLGNGNINCNGKYNGTERLKDMSYDTSKFEKVFGSEVALVTSSSTRTKYMMKADSSSGDASSWWLRSARTDYSYSVGNVSYYGVVSNYSASHYSGVLPACIIG